MVRLVSTLDSDIRTKLAKKYEREDKQAGIQIVACSVVSLLLACIEDMWAPLWFADIVQTVIYALAIWTLVNVCFIIRWPAAAFMDDIREIEDK